MEQKQVLAEKYAEADLWQDYLNNIVKKRE